MAYAIFKTGGKQYRVSEGDTLEVEKLNVEEGTETDFPEVLLVSDGDNVQVGSPFVDGAKVTAQVVAQKRAPKVTAFKFKPRKGYHKTKGHRRLVTRLEITKISG